MSIINDDMVPKRVGYRKYDGQLYDCGLLYLFSHEEDTPGSPPYGLTFSCGVRIDSKTGTTTVGIGSQEVAIEAVTELHQQIEVIDSVISKAGKASGPPVHRKPGRPAREHRGCVALWNTALENTVRGIVRNEHVIYAGDFHVSGEGIRTVSGSDIATAPVVDVWPQTVVRFCEGDDRIDHLRGHTGDTKLVRVADDASRRDAIVHAVHANMLVAEAADRAAVALGMPGTKKRTRVRHSASSGGGSAKEGAGMPAAKKAKETTATKKEEGAAGSGGGGGASSRGGDGGGGGASGGASSGGDDDGDDHSLELAPAAKVSAAAPLKTPAKPPRAAAASRTPKPTPKSALKSPATWRSKTVEKPAVAMRRRTVEKRKSPGGGAADAAAASAAATTATVAAAAAGEAAMEEEEEEAPLPVAAATADDMAMDAGNGGNSGGDDTMEGGDDEEDDEEAAAGEKKAGNGRRSARGANKCSRMMLEEERFCVLARELMAETLFKAPGGALWFSTLPSDKWSVTLAASAAHCAGMAATGASVHNFSRVAAEHANRALDAMRAASRAVEDAGEAEAEGEEKGAVGPLELNATNPSATDFVAVANALRAELMAAAAVEKRAEATEGAIKAVAASAACMSPVGTAQEPPAVAIALLEEETTRLRAYLNFCRNEERRLRSAVAGRVAGLRAALKKLRAAGEGLAEAEQADKYVADLMGHYRELVASTAVASGVGWNRCTLM